jgi:hypothetical protein
MWWLRQRDAFIRRFILAEVLAPPKALRPPPRPWPAEPPARPAPAPSPVRAASDEKR